VYIYYKLYKGGGVNMSVGVSGNLGAYALKVDYLDKVTYDPLLLNTVEGTLLKLALSDTLMYSEDAPHEEVNPVAVTVCQTIGVPTAMSAASAYRMTFEAKRSNATDAAFVFWYVNAVGDGASEAINVGAGIYKAFTRDVAGIDPGDDISVRVQESGGGNVITVKEFRIKGTVTRKYTGVW
jgi:hypothetical protein